MSLQIKKVLHDEQSQYQHVIVFESETWGHVLILDGVLQLAEKDECAYQEMITHIPMFAHPNPQSVLVVGGGDGGVLREVLKHKSVKHVTICEIDQMVMDVSKQYFAKMTHVWSDPRLTVVCGDASEYVARKENQNKYDVIICDSSDPVGPAESLFDAAFYHSMCGALKPGGRITTQTNSLWIFQDLIARLMRRTRSVFAAVEYASTQIPTYPTGQCGFLCCTKAGGAVADTMTRPVRALPADMDTSYYHAALHEAAFVLPRFICKLIEGVNADAPAGAVADTKHQAAAATATAAPTPSATASAAAAAKDKSATATAPAPAPTAGASTAAAHM